MKSATGNLDHCKYYDSKDRCPTGSCEWKLDAPTTITLSGYKCTCNKGFAGATMPNAPASCAAVPTSGCVDLQYTNNGQCTASADITATKSGMNADGKWVEPMHDNCRHSRDKTECLGKSKDGKSLPCNWTPANQQQVPWHSRNGMDNTCARMVKYKYCSSDYFNTFDGVKVTSAQACCGCNGGSTFCGDGAIRTTSGNDFVCSCSAAYIGATVTNGIATCVERTCADSDGANNAASCGVGASCSDERADDGYKVSKTLI